jgi:DNA-binding transcriptional LysR family regulator
MQDLRTLAIFVKVAERLSFVGAAPDFGITQSTKSPLRGRLRHRRSVARCREGR